MNFLESINEFIANKDIKMSQKLSITIILIALAVIINDSIGFTYSYEIDNKISQMESLNKIISDEKTDSVGRKYAENLRKEVYYRKTFTQSIYKYIKEINWNKAETEKVDNSYNYPESNRYNKVILLYHLTSSVAYYLAGIVLFLTILLLSRGVPLVQRFASALVGGGVCIVLGLVLYLICSLIPVISSDYIIINYAINVIIQILSVYGLNRINALSKKINF